MKKNRGRLYGQKRDSDLSMAIRAFEDGHATPEILWAIISGSMNVFDEMVSAGYVDAGEPAGQFLDAVLGTILSSRTVVANKRIEQ